MADNKKTILSINNLNVKFKVRGRILTAIRGISLDIKEGEAIAIVGESGSGKSVFTKTFAGMLDSNGFIDEGSIIFNDEDLQDTVVHFNGLSRRIIARTKKKLDAASVYELGGQTYKEIAKLEKAKLKAFCGDHEVISKAKSLVKDTKAEIVDLTNEKQILDKKNDAARIEEINERIKELNPILKANQAILDEYYAKKEKFAGKKLPSNPKYDDKIEELKAKYAEEIAGEVPEGTSERNEILAREIYLSVGRFNYSKRVKYIRRLSKAIVEAMKKGRDINNENVRNEVFEPVTFRVRYIDVLEEQKDGSRVIFDEKAAEEEKKAEKDNKAEKAKKHGKLLLHGTCIINLAKVNYYKDWCQIRGSKIATVFQDPMTSLNPIITIGRQITSVIMKHQKVSENEARLKAIELMKKVGIPNAEARFDDYPFQYSGGMRQRIVIAIALSCQPKILICDEPTTALDVTIQAQILKLIKDLQKEFGYTIVFITHDLGVVANIADRVAVLYAGQVIEVGNVDEVFYDPRHPYTWALLSSLPQLAERNTKLYSITGTPPSLYNKIVGDAFAPRNPYCMKIDTLLEPPMFKVTDTHYAKTWLLEPNAPHVDKPEIIQDIHEKLVRAFNI